jgi:plastocyanin
MIPSSRSIAALAASLVLAATALAGCSSDNSYGGSNTTAAPAATTTTAAAAETTATPVPADAGATLTIEGFAFSGGPFTANTPITLVNKDSAPHTVTDDAGSFSVEVPAGGTAELTIAAAGSYEIHCEVHPRMTSTITVN